MRNKISLIVLLTVTLFILGCLNDDDNPTAPTIVATEEWGFIMDNDSANHGEATLEKKSDGSISTNAVWNFVQDGYNVECPVESGEVIVNGDSILVTAQGIATNSNPNIPAGYNTSSFTINIIGYANDGQSHGDWGIGFSTYGWPQTLQGTYTATRKSGAGVTN
ncbi:MAG: hypothetical protein WCY30_06410 [Candidatus Neomarinimicrobiota bacterium]